MILVTGATGFLGRHVFAALLGAGWPARALVRDRARYRAHFPAGPAPIEADLTRLRRGDLEQERVEGIVHLAAEVWPVERADPRAFGAVNVEGTRALLEAVDPAKLETIVVASSLAVHGPLTGRIDEKSPVHPSDAYGRSKLEQEVLARNFAARHDVKCIVLRFPSIYGADATGPTVVPRFLERARAAKTLEVKNPRGRHQSFLHVDDAATAVVAALGSDANGLYIVAPPPVSMEALARAVAGAAERAGLRRPAVRLLAEEDAPRIFSVDASKAERELGWRPRYDLVGGLLEALRAGEGSQDPA